MFDPVTTQTLLKLSTHKAFDPVTTQTPLKLSTHKALFITQHQQKCQPYI